MDRIEKFKSAFKYTVSLAVISISYELRVGSYIFPDLLFANTLLAVCSVVVGASAASRLADLAFRCGGIRSYVLGPLNVSGYWLVETDPHDGKDESLILEPALIDMRFDSQTSEFKVDAYRYVNGKEYITKSESASVKKHDFLRYCNVFEIETLDQTHRHGHACGKFNNDAGEIARSLTATIMLEGEGISRTQRGRRIETWKIKAFKKKFGKRNWKERFLETGGKVCDGQPIDRTEKNLLETIKHPRSSAKERKVANAELENYRAKISSRRGVLSLPSWLGRKSARF